MATTAQFVSQPTLEISQISTLNTARDGTGTISLVCAGPTTTSAAGIGKRINRVIVQATGTTTPGMVRFFISNDGSVTDRLITEKPISAITPSGTIAAYRSEVSELVGFVLPGAVSGSTSGIWASTNNGETFNIIVESGIL